MGFLDKAKQLAEQAQQKLDEAQKNFNQSGSPQAQPDEGAVKYDEHGRPIQETDPAGEAAPAPPPDPASPPPPPDPASSSPPSDPVSPGDAGGTEGAPAGPEPTRQPETPDQGGGGQANASPDPFKPLQQ
jgi:hypothetical protein